MWKAFCQRFSTAGKLCPALLDGLCECAEHRFCIYFSLPSQVLKAVQSILQNWSQSCQYPSDSLIFSLLFPSLCFQGYKSCSFPSTSVALIRLKRTAISSFLKGFSSPSFPSFISSHEVFLLVAHHSTFTFFSIAHHIYLFLLSSCLHMSTHSSPSSSLLPPSYGQQHCRWGFVRNRLHSLCLPNSMPLFNNLCPLQGVFYLPPAPPRAGKGKQTSWHQQIRRERKRKALWIPA